MEWRRLIRNIPELYVETVSDTIEIKGITDKSSEVQEGYIFVAIQGFKTDGHKFISEAAERGASVVVGQRPIEQETIPYVHVNNTRKILGQLAASFYEYPSEDKLVIGVTGTNGKTTTGLFLRHLLRKEGYSVSFFGTVFNEVNNERSKSDLTTPNSLMIQKALAESEDQVAVIEVSSQGLEQFRMEGMTFDYALFTNLQHDHLDYHNSMDEYFLAKKKLFDLLKSSGKAVINEESKWGKKLTNLLVNEEKTVITVGEDDQFTRYRLENSSRGICVIGDRTYEISLPLPGKYNLANLSLALTVLSDLQHDLTNVSELMKDMDVIPGRFEVYELSDRVSGIVDYAHTAEALQALLPTIRELYSDYRLVHLFGFRGNRDISKREKMLEVSKQYSDEIVLILDDLNGVSVEEMEKEYNRFRERDMTDKVSVILDRTLAVSQLVEEATEPTLIVLSGKGHEDYQQDFQLSAKSDKETFLLFTDHKRLS